MLHILAVLLTLPVGADVSLQDDDEDAVPWQIRAYGGGGFWGGFWEFESNLPTRTATIRGDYAGVMNAGVSLGQDAGVEFFAEYEFDVGRDFQQHSFVTGLGYTWRRFGQVFGEPMGQKWNVSLGALAGIVDVTQERFPGDFDPGFGAQGTIEYRLLFSPNFALHARGGIRYSRFNYNPSAEVTSSDTFMGGLSALLLLGADLTF